MEWSSLSQYFDYVLGLLDSSGGSRHYGASSLIFDEDKELGILQADVHFQDGSRLETESDLKPNESILGATYLLAMGPLSELAEIDREGTVVLVDIGRFEELLTAQSAQRYVIFLPPESLYYHVQDLSP